MVQEVLLIYDLSTFMASLCPLVLKSMFTFSSNSSVASPFLTQESVFKRAVITGIYSTLLYCTVWLIYAGSLRL